MMRAMTSTAFPLLVRHSPLATAAVVLLTLLVAVIEVPHASPASTIATATASA